MNGRLTWVWADRAQLHLGLLGRLEQPLQRLRILAQVDAVLLLELVGEVVDEAAVEVVAAQVGVAGGGPDLDHPVADVEDAHVEGAAAEVEHEDRLVALLVQPVGQRGRGRLPTRQCRQDLSLQNDRIDVVIMTSDDFDPSPALEDPDGKLVADDIKDPGKFTYTAETRAITRSLAGSFPRTYQEGLVCPDGLRRRHHFCPKTPGKDVPDIGTILVPDNPKVDAKPSKPGDLQFTKIAQIEDSLTKNDSSDGKGKFFKSYRIRLDAGKLYSVQMVGKKFEAFVRLDSDAGMQLKQEETNEGNSSGLVFRPTTSDFYRVVASTFNNGQVGEFSLVVTELELRQAVREPLSWSGDSFHLALRLSKQDGLNEHGKYHRVFVLKAEANKVYRFEMAGKFGPYLTLESQFGSPIKNEDFGDMNVSRLVMRTTKAGIFHLQTSGFHPGAIGDFVLKGTVAEAKDAKPTPVEYQQVKMAQVTAAIKEDAIDVQGRLHKAWLEGVTGKAYKIEVSSKNIHVGLSVEATDGNTLEAKSYDRFVNFSYRPIKSGTLRVLVYSRPPVSKGASPFRLRGLAHNGQDGALGPQAGDAHFGGRLALERRRPR